MTPQTPNYQASAATPVSQYNRQTYPQNAAQASYASSQAQSHIPQQPVPHNVQQLHHTSHGLAAAHPGNYAGAAPVQAYQRPAIPQYQTQQYPQNYATNNDQGLRYKEVFVLPDNANEAIPKSIRDALPQDDQGRVLFFAQPPLDTRHIVEGKAESEKGRPLVHSDKYLKFKLMKEQLLAKRKRDQQDDGDHQSTVSADGALSLAESQHPVKRVATRDPVAEALITFNRHMEQGTIDFYKINYGDKWQMVMDSDLKKESQQSKSDHSQQNDQAKAAATKKEPTRMELYQQHVKENREKGFSKNFWTGLYLDDADPRLPPFN